MKGQITPYLEQITVNGNLISDCSTIAFGTNSSVDISLKIRVTKSSTNDVGNFATFKLYILRNGSSSPQFIDGILVNNSAFWNNGTLWEGVFNQTLQAADIDVSGSVFYGVYEVSTDIHPNTCNYPLTKTPPPSFTLSPTSLSLQCGDTSVKTFTVTPANIPIGDIVSYQWNYTGWVLVSSTGNSKTLKPSSGTTLPSSVTVTPFINGINQPSKSCSISRTALTINPTISGSSALCPSSIQSVYTISNAGTGNTVTWSLSNTSIATILSFTNTTATVKGLQNGAVTLTATITNACNQQVVKTYDINVVANAGQITAPISYVTNTNFLNYCMNPQNTNTCGFQSKTIVSTANNLKPVKFDMSLQLGNASIQQLIDPIAYNYAPTGETRYSGDIYGKFYSSPIVVSVKANYACNISSGNFVTYMSLMGVANKISQTNNSYEIRISPNKAKDFVTITKEDFDIPYLKVVDKYLNREVSDAELEIMKNEISVLEKSINQKTIVKLFDFNSKEIFTTEMTTNELEINVSKFAKGLYIINVERGIEKVTQKLIIE
jgi:hypothetical protein